MDWGFGMLLLLPNLAHFARLTSALSVVKPADGGVAFVAYRQSLYGPQRSGTDSC
jgi:hypothetical protein